MRVRRKTMVGRIGERGEIQCSWEMLQDFCSSHKGKPVILRLEIQPTEPSERTQNYFYGYCIPEAQNAFMTEYGEHLTKEQTYNKIRELCPLFQKQERENGKWRTTYVEFEDLDQAEANDAIEWLCRFLAEEFSVILDMPRR